MPRERERSERDLIGCRRQIMRKPCCYEKEETNKGAWSKQEDQKLIDYIQTHGEGFWRSLPKAAGLHRCGKCCRLRWINYLKPNIKRRNFAQDEEDLIIKLHALLGNRWSLIAGRLPGRTDNEIKNYWDSHIRRKLMKMGIDPENHKLIRHLHNHRPHHDAAATSKENPNSSSNLNLDLTIAFDPNTAESSHNNNNSNNTDKDDMDHRHTQSATPTLPLFN